MNFADGEGLYAPQINAMLAAFQGTGVLSGCAASATGVDRVISVTSGSIMIGAATVPYAGGSVTLESGGAVDRYDLITISAAGVLAATKGVEEKKCPPPPANTCIIAIARVPASATVVATGDVTDASVQIMQWMPPGVILQWPGSLGSIPTGWHLCDGTNGTPDLRDLFVVGAGGDYEVGATGGEATHALTVDEMPSHTHSGSAVVYSVGGASLNGSGGYTPTGIGSTGGGDAHENRPPYYALAYIMKLP